MGFPSRGMLDSVAKDQPIYFTAKSMHAGWANSAALQRAGINADTPDPRDGAIQRDLHGEPTGILLESAMAMISRAIPSPDTPTVLSAMERGQQVLLSLGLTGIHDFDRRRCFDALQILHSDRKLKLRVLKSIPAEDLEHAIEVGLRTGFGDDQLRIGNVKAFADGALGPHTAAMLEPYENEPANRGILMLDGEEAFELGCRAAENGLGLVVHAIGDRANHEILNAYEALRRHEKTRNLPHYRHRIEHVQVIHPDDLPRLADLDLIASMQPIHATSDMLAADEFWGRRSQNAYSWNSLLSHGTRLAFGSDAPVEWPNPFWGIYAAISRRRRDGSPGPQGWYPQEKIERRAAFAAYTTGAAYAAGSEDRQGRLDPGCLADLILLDRDPFDCPAEELGELRPLRTMVAGDWVFER